MLKPKRSATLAESRSGTTSREKGRITLVSLVAAVALTLLKLAAGLATGSLGLLSEAAHSGLDTVSSIFTFISVRVAERPADDDHPYGHGRFENLSAVLQGALLLITAGFIIVEAGRRLLSPGEAVAVSYWAFGVMGLSVAVDLWRSRLLMAAARKYRSRALEADALNFRADLLSSSVVIVGLVLTVLAGRSERLGWLGSADALAALVVGLNIVWMSAQLALRSLNVMLDRVPVALRERVTQAVKGVPGVIDTGAVRLRESGHLVFADVTVSTSRALSLTEAHRVSERVEAAVREVEPRAETVVHVEPVAVKDESATAALRATAAALGFDVHHEQVHEIGERLEASLHLVVSPTLTLEEAHRRAHELVAAARRDNPQLTRVETHLEVTEPDLRFQREVSREHPETVRRIQDVLEGSDPQVRVHEVRLYRHDASQDAWEAVVHCGFPKTLDMREVHRRTEELELRLRQALPNLEQVLIHAEPSG